MEKREVAERFVTLFGNLQETAKRCDQEFATTRKTAKRHDREFKETRENIKRLDRKIDENAKHLDRKIDEKFESTNESLNHILRLLNVVVPAYALPVQEPVALVEDDAVPTEPETTIPSEETVDAFEFLSLPQVEVETSAQGENEGDVLAIEEQAQVPERSSRDELICEWENTEREQDERGRELGDANSTESEEEEEESDDGFITYSESDQFDISDDSEDLAEFTTSGSDQELAAEYKAQKDLSDSGSSSSDARFWANSATEPISSLAEVMMFMPCMVESSTQDESWDASVLQPEGVVGLAEAVHTSEYGSDDALDKYVNKVSPISDCSDVEEPQSGITESLLPIEEELLGGVDIDTQASTGRPASITAIVDTSESEEAQEDLAHHNDDTEAPALESAPLVIPLFETAVLLVDSSVPDSFIHRELDDDDYNVDRDDPVPLEEEIMPVCTEVAVASLQDDARPPSREETTHATLVCTTIGEPTAGHEPDAVHCANESIESSSSKEEEIPVCTEVAVATLQDDDAGLPPPFIALVTTPITKRTNITTRRFENRCVPISDKTAREKINSSVTFKFGVLFKKPGAQMWCIPGSLMIDILKREGYTQYKNAGLTTASATVIDCLTYLLFLRMRTTGTNACNRQCAVYEAARYHAPEIGKEWVRRINLLRNHPTIFDDFSMRHMFAEKALFALDVLGIEICDKQIQNPVGLDVTFSDLLPTLPYNGHKQYCDTL